VHVRRRSRGTRTYKLLSFLFLCLMLAQTKHTAGGFAPRVDAVCDCKRSGAGCMCCMHARAPAPRHAGERPASRCQATLRLSTAGRPPKRALATSQGEESGRVRTTARTGRVPAVLCAMCVSGSASGAMPPPACGTVSALGYSRSRQITG